MTDEPEQGVWDDDILGRKQDADILRRFLIKQLEVREANGMGNTYVLNLDSQWGGGKTFFLKRFKCELEKHGHVAAYVDAWASDHADDPLIAVFSEVKAQLEEVAEQNDVLDKIQTSIKPVKASVGKIVTKVSVGALKQIIRKYVGEGDGEEVLEALGEEVVGALGDEVIGAFEETMSSIDAFKKELENLFRVVVSEAGKQPPVFILIDELDRCRPNYAVSLLERVKHLFSVEGVVFIIATDTEQLAHAVSGTYGSSFNGARYLKRFFERTYRFQPVSIDRFVKEQFRVLGLSKDDFEAMPEEGVIDFCVRAFSLGDTQLRDIKRMMEKLQTFWAVWPYPDMKIQLAYLLPLIHADHFAGEVGYAENPQILDLTSQVNVANRGGEAYLPDTVSVKDFISVVDGHGHDIFAFTEKDRRGGVSQWVRNVFRKEEILVHNNAFNPANPPASALLSYSSLLTQVAAFDAPADE